VRERRKAQGIRHKVKGKRLKAEEIKSNFEFLVLNSKLNIKN
jgi:hypothetical protein